MLLDFLAGLGRKDLSTLEAQPMIAGTSNGLAHSPVVALATPIPWDGAFCLLARHTVPCHVLGGASESFCLFSEDLRVINEVKESLLFFGPLSYPSSFCRRLTTASIATATPILGDSALRLLARHTSSRHVLSGASESLRLFR